MRVVWAFLFCCLGVGLSAQIYLEVAWDPQEFVFAQGQGLTLSAWNGYDETPLTFKWYIEDAFKNEGPSYFTMFSAIGQHRVKVDGYSGPDLVASWQATFFVRPSSGNFDVNSWISVPDRENSVVQAGQSVHLEAQGTSGTNQFFWQVLGWGYTHMGSSWDFVAPSQDGYLDILLFGINTDGFVTPYPSIHSLYVYTNNIPPDTQITQPVVGNDGMVSVNVGDSVAFSAVGSDPDTPGELAYVWFWDGPDGYRDFSGQFQNFTFESAGYHTIYARSIDAQGGEDPFPAEVGVFAKGANTPPVVWILQGSGTYEAGEGLAFEASGYDDEFDAIAYQWQLSDGRQFQGAQIEFSVTEPGAYQLDLTGLDERGAQSQVQSVWVLVNPAENYANSAPYASITNPKGDELYPQATVFQFSAVGFDYEDDVIVDFFWDLSDGTLVRGNSVSHAYTPDPGSNVQLVYPQVFSQDSSGNFSWYGDSQTLALYQGTRPPEGVILSPLAQQTLNPYQEPRVVVKPGESLTLKGGLKQGSTQGKRAYWSLYHESGTAIVIEGFEPTPIAFESFALKGGYSVYFTVIDENGLEDPLPDSIYVWIRDSNLAPEIWIEEPGWDNPYQVGEGFDLVANGYDEDGDDIRFSWLLSDGRQLDGPSHQHIQFSAAGLHWAELHGTDSEGLNAALSPRRYFPVYGGEDDYYRAPTVIPVNPNSPKLLGPPMARFSFSARAGEGETGLLQYFWDFGNGQTSPLQNPGEVTFQLPGFYSVRVYAANSDGIWSAWPVTWEVYIYGANVPPNAEIIAPAQRSHPDFYQRNVIPVLQGQPIPLVGKVTDPDGNYPVSLAWWVDGEFYSSALEPPALVLNEAGFHSLELYCWDSLDLQDPFYEFREIQVVDPSLKPESYISEPYGDLTVEPGQEVYFFGYGEDPNQLEMTYHWTFEGGLPNQVEGEEVYPVIFPTPSPEGQPYKVTFQVKTEFTQDTTPATILVTVKQYQDDDFEPNDAFEDAKPLQQGQYSALSLTGGSDHADYYSFEIDESGKDLGLSINVVEGLDNLDYEFYRYSAGEWLPVGLVGENGTDFRLSNLPEGSYVLKVALNQAAQKRKDGLSYGIGLSTNQPNVYLPFLVEDGNLSSTLGLINPNGQAAEIVVVGLDEQGRKVDSKNLTIPAMGRVYAASLSFFGFQDRVEKARSIRWVKVLSGQRLVGYMTATSRDKTQLVGIEGIPSLSSRLVIPHIAVKTEQWYTRSITINAGESPGSLQFVGSGSTTAIANTKANSQTDFRFNEVFAQLPEWGQFKDAEEKANLAGIEMFGRVDGPKTLAGFDLTPSRLGNPNFFHLTKSLIFLHVAKDTANFWTGISLINLATTENTVQLLGYDDSGQVLSQKSLTLAPRAKLVSVVGPLFDQVPGISWVQVIGNADIAGFELFGDNESTRISGFQASDSLTDQLIFPHIAADNEQWTGIALLNAEEGSVTLTIEAYDDLGTLLVQRQEVQAGRTKLVRTAQVLFPEGLPPTATWVRVRADRQALVGFELFGNLNPNGSLGERMAGILALTP
ncbi:MAG: hypothetical protein H6510_04920 [Acidobacteria bacterium]|nr:hypothetical protein [Acidobacteriota bacterium]